jgi:hypothetical protein
LRPISGFMGPFGPKRRITPARPPVLTQDVTTNGSGKWQRQVQPGQPGLTPDGMIYRPGEGPVTGPAPDRSVFRPSNQTPQPNSPDEQQGALAPVPHVVPPGIVVNASCDPSQRGHQKAMSQTAHERLIGPARECRSPRLGTLQPAFAGTRTQGGDLSGARSPEPLTEQKAADSTPITAALLKAAIYAGADTGPYSGQQASAVSGLDEAIGASEHNRENNPGHYWANPLVGARLPRCGGDYSGDSRGVKAGPTARPRWARRCHERLAFREVKTGYTC